MQQRRVSSWIGKLNWKLTEISWSQLNIKGSNILYVGAYSRPNEGDEISIDQPEASLLRVGDKDEKIQLAGDFTSRYGSQSLRSNQSNLHHHFR